MKDNFEYQPGFLPIPGYEGRYSCNQEGVVHSHLKNPKGLPHAIKTNNNGYKYVTLATRNPVTPTKSVGIGWILAILFLPNPENYPDIEFINGDAGDIRLDNIRWVKHNFRSRKTQSYVYRAWHRDAPDKIHTHKSRLGLARICGIKKAQIESYLFNCPGVYHYKTGWAVDRYIDPDFHARRLVLDVKKK